MVVDAGSDGNPYATEALFRGETQPTTYTNGQQATTLFYHDHVHGWDYFLPRLVTYAATRGARA